MTSAVCSGLTEEAELHQCGELLLLPGTGAGRPLSDTMIRQLEQTGQVLFRLQRHALEKNLVPLWEEENSQVVLKKLTALDWELPTSPGFFVIRAMAPYRPGGVRFFMDFVPRAVSDVTPLNVVAGQGAEFRFASRPQQRMIAVELIVEVETRGELNRLRQLLPEFASDLLLGLESAEHASRLLELRGLPADGKTLAVQEWIKRLTKRDPQRFTPELITEMQHYQAAFPLEFSRLRSSRHLMRIVASSFLLRRQVREQAVRQERRVTVRLLSTSAPHLLPTLGLFCVLHPLRAREEFEEAHLMQAVQRCWPDATMVPGSALIRTSRPGGTRAIYLEIASSRAGSPQERRRLRSSLPGLVKGAVERLVPPVFMPRNDEEIMRNMMTLAGQLRFVSDLPQVAVILEGHHAQEVTFVVICLRLGRPGVPPIHRQLASAAQYRWVVERSRVMGLVRRRYQKEAYVLRVQVPHDQFLRPDLSLDLYRARRAVLSELVQCIGPVRDFNGGMWEQQEKCLAEIMQHLGPLDELYQARLETLFHTITPGERRGILPPAPLAHWLRAALKLMALHEGGQEAPPLVCTDNAEFCWGLEIVPNSSSPVPAAALQPAPRPERGWVTLQIPVEGGVLRGILWHRPSDSQRRRWLEEWQASASPSPLT